VFEFGVRILKYGRLVVFVFKIIYTPYWRRGGAVGGGIALQTGRPRVRFSIVSIILPADSSCNRNEYQEYFLGGKADNLTTFMCRLSGNLGALTSRNPQGLSRSV
jgi:hypothetical protein